jgi:hypothetical protein
MPSMPRLSRRCRLLLLVCLGGVVSAGAMAGCKRQATAPPPPPPAKVSDLGRPLWVAVATAAPDGSERLLGVAHAGSLEVMSWPGQTVKWRAKEPWLTATQPPSDQAIRLMAVIGQELVWLRADGKNLRLITYRLADGALLSDRQLEGAPTAPAPAAPAAPGAAADGGAPAAETGVPAASRPLGLMGAPDGSGLWILFPETVGALKPGARMLELRRPAEYVREARAAQDGKSLWIPDDTGLRRLGVGAASEAPAAKGEVQAPVVPDRVNGGCTPFAFSVDPDTDRAALVCPGKRLQPELRVIRLSDGRRLGTHALRTAPGRVAVLSPTTLPPPRGSLVSADVLVFGDTPRTLGWLGPGPAQTWESASLRWKRIEVSPDGTRAVGLGGSGELEVIDLESGKSLCNQAQLWPLVPVTAGFASDGRLWVLGSTEPALVEVDVEACRVSRRQRLDLDGVDNVPTRRPTWLPSISAFFLVGQFRGRDIPMTIPVLPGQLRKSFLAGAGWFSSMITNPEGTRVAFARRSEYQVYSVTLRSGPPAELPTLNGADRILLCSERVVAHGPSGWAVFDATNAGLSADLQEAYRNGTKTPPGAGARLEPGGHLECRGDVLVAREPYGLRVLDLPTLGEKARYTLLDPGRPTWRVMPDGRRLLLDGGATGWRVLKL